MPDLHQQINSVYRDSIATDKLAPTSSMFVARGTESMGRSLLKQFRFRVYIPILYDRIVKQIGEEVFGTDSVQCHSKVKFVREVLL